MRQIFVRPKKGTKESVGGHQLPCEPLKPTTVLIKNSEGGFSESSFPLRFDTGAPYTMVPQAFLIGSGWTPEEIHDDKKLVSTLSFNGHRSDAYIVDMTLTFEEIPDLEFPLRCAVARDSLQMLLGVPDIMRWFDIKSGMQFKEGKDGKFVPIRGVYFILREGHNGQPTTPTSDSASAHNNGTIDDEQHTPS